MELANLFRKGNGLMMYGNVFLTVPCVVVDGDGDGKADRVQQLLELRKFKMNSDRIAKALRQKYNQFFVHTVVADSLHRGILALAQTSGIR